MESSVNDYVQLLQVAAMCIYEVENCRLLRFFNLSLIVKLN